jgi:MFS family permease
MQRAAQGWLVYELTDRPIYLGLVAACGTIPMLLLSLPAGVVADRLPKRNILLVTQSLAMVQAFVLAALIYTGAIQVWHVMVLAAFFGTVWAFDMPTRHAMVLEFVTKDDTLNAVSLNSSAFMTGRIVGPAIGGVLIEVVGMAACFLINGVTFIAVLVALLVIAPRPPVVRTRAAFLREMGEGISWVRRNAVPLTLLVLIAISSLYGLSYAVLLPVFARDTFAAGPLGYGLMHTAYAVGGLAAAVFLTSAGHRRRLGWLTTVAAFLLPIGLLLFAGSPTYAIAIGALAVAGMGGMGFNVTANTILQKMSPDELRGRVMSLRSFLFAGTSWLGDLQVSMFAEWFTERLAVAIGAGICLTAAVVAWWKAPELRRTE